MISSPHTNGFNGFSMVLGSFNHWFQWFSMVMDHWSNDAMVSMYRSPLDGGDGGYGGDGGDRGGEVDQGEVSTI